MGGCMLRAMSAYREQRTYPLHVATIAAIAGYRLAPSIGSAQFGTEHALAGTGCTSGNIRCIQSAASHVYPLKLGRERG